MTASPPVTHQALEPALLACTQGDTVGFQRLQQLGLPRVLSVTSHFLAEPPHVEAVVHDTLLMAWRNAHRLADSGLPPGHWLFTILSCRLHNQLSALEGALPPPSPADGQGPPAELERIPAERRGPALWELSQRLPPAAPGQALEARLGQTLQTLRQAARLPLTPTGESVHPPLYDPSLRRKMLTSRLAYRAKMAFQRTLGRPVEDRLFRHWQARRDACRMLETQGLPRRSLETTLGERLDLGVDPRRLVRGFSYPAGFPDRLQRRKASNLFLWDGDWDLPRHYLIDSSQTRFMQDLWHYRLAPEQSATFQTLEARSDQGNPLRSHHRGLLLDGRERILEYLRLYLLYMEGMACFGFDAEAGKDRLGVAVDRHGRLIKINKGLHRLAMAQVLGLPRVTVRVRSVHRRWWNDQTEGASGHEALERLAQALPDCTPAR
ncbi:RNA polymerase sigma factor [Halomonas sp. HK25]|uniref:RNA polymerase sigma factor n=1 Tax=Halomonas sp. HK25 TaxID=3394321 RepID=UPI0039FC3D4F